MAAMSQHLEDNDGAVSPAAVPEIGGQGGEVLADAHHLREDLRLAGRAIRRGWGGAKRWNTDVTSKELEERMRTSDGQLTLKERTLLACMSGVTSSNERVSGIAARNVIAMEAQNQADELKQLPDLHLNIHKMAEDEKKDRLASILAAAKGRKAGANGQASNGQADVQA